MYIYIYIYIYMYVLQLSRNLLIRRLFLAVERQGEEAGSVILLQSEFWRSSVWEFSPELRMILLYIISSYII